MALACKAVLSSRKTLLIIGCDFSSVTDDMLLLKYRDIILSEVTSIFLSDRNVKKSSSMSVLAESSLVAVALSMLVSVTCCCVLLNKKPSPIRFCPGVQMARSCPELRSGCYFSGGTAFRLTAASNQTERSGTAFRRLTGLIILSTTHNDQLITNDQ